MVSRITAVALYAVQPRVVADFWCSVLDWEVLEEDGDGTTIGSPTGSWATIDVFAVPRGEAGDKPAAGRRVEHPGRARTAARARR